MSEKDFIEREAFEGFGELPEDLRGASPISLPAGGYIPGQEMDGYSIVGGAYRPFVEPIPGALGNPVNFTATSYLPRANYESFRSQRFLAWGFALVPPDPTVFVPLLVNIASLPPGSPQTASGGPLQVPIGYTAVITGIRQWVGDSNAVEKPNGQPDDISWQVAAGTIPIFNFGNIPMLMSSLTQEGHLFAVVNENIPIQVSVMNSINPLDPLARSIPVSTMLTGHWFPIDEIDDIFRNR